MTYDRSMALALSLAPGRLPTGRHPTPTDRFPERPGRSREDINIPSRLTGYDRSPGVNVGFAEEAPPSAGGRKRQFEFLRS